MGKYKDAIFAATTKEIRSCKSVEQLEQSIKQFVPFIDAKYFVYHNYLPSLHEINSVRNVSREFFELYYERDYRRHDPRVLYCIQNSEIVRWCDLEFSDGAVGRIQSKIFADLASYGMGDGITIPIHGVGSEVAWLNISAPRGELPHYDHIDLSLLALYAQTIHKKFKDIRFEQEAAHKHQVQLTTREKDVMQWTVMGKTAWEISQILDCSESTIVFHLANISKKLDTKNRAQTVAKVLNEAHINQFCELDEKSISEKTDSIATIS